MAKTGNNQQKQPSGCPRMSMLEDIMEKMTAGCKHMQDFSREHYKKHDTEMRNMPSWINNSMGLSAGLTQQEKLICELGLLHLRFPMSRRFSSSIQHDLLISFNSCLQCYVSTRAQPLNLPLHCLPDIYYICGYTHIHAHMCRYLLTHNYF